MQFHPENLADITVSWPHVVLFLLLVAVTYAVRLRWRHHRAKEALKRIRSERDRLRDQTYRASVSQ